MKYQKPITETVAEIRLVGSICDASGDPDSGGAPARRNELRY